MRKAALALLLVLTALPVSAAAPSGQPGAGEIARLQAEFRDERARALRLRAEAAEAGASGRRPSSPGCRRRADIRPACCRRCR